MKKKSIIRVSLITAAILCIPAIAMFFTDEVNWDFFDFLVMGALLFCTGLAFEFLASRASNLFYKIGVAMSILTGFLLIWVNLAVGFVGSGANLPNLLYGVVVLIAFFSSILSAFKARKMANAMFATAVAQALVPILSFIIMRPDLNPMYEAPGIIGVFVLNSIFVALWTGAGLLFRQAGRAERENGNGRLRSA